MEIEWKKFKKRFIARFITIVTITLIIYVVVIIAINPIGDLLNYSACPNCGDNSLWKPIGSIPIGPTRPLDANNVEHIIYAEIIHGIMICKECLKKPAELDEEKIEQYLLSFPKGGWTPEKTAEVKQAVIRYKKEKLQSQQ